MRKLLKWSGLRLAGLVLLIALAGVGGFIWLRQSLPVTAGEVRVAGPTAPVTLLRDADGLLTVQAASRLDGAFGLGYAHAQDRLAQMMLTRRLGQGRLSEIAGRATLTMDKLMRSLDLAALSEAAVAHLEPETLSLLQAYADGVNAWLATRPGPLPPELALLEGEPEAWRPADSLLWGKLMALRLSGNWRDELRNARLAAALSEVELAELFPAPPADSPATLPRWAADVLPAPWLTSLPHELHSYGASNAWVLAGERTATGLPILANDPHLMLQAPSTWYLARVETPEGVVAGATAPGVPVVLIGHNGHIAWGFTTTHSDTQDLVVERLDPDDPARYLTPDGPRAFDTREVAIGLRGGEHETVELRRSRFGPVISDVSRRAGSALPAIGDDVVLALAWPALIEADTSADALVRLNAALDWPAFVDAMARFVSPQQNVFYADRQGNIGFYTPGLLPIREGYDGSRPVPAWQRRQLWRGFVPFAELPHALNPDGGSIVNANNRIVGPDYPYLVATEWEAPYRAERIEAVLAEETTHDLDASSRLQLDETSLVVRQLLPLMLAATPSPGEAARAHALLAAWNGDMARDRPEPLIFHAWLRSLTERLFQARLDDLYDQVAFWHPMRLHAVLTETTHWCGSEGCEAALRNSLDDALVLLERLDAGPLEEMRWGDFHRARLAHPILGRVPLLRDLFDIVVETGGDNFTVNRGTPVFEDESRLFRHVHGPGLRAVFDLSDLDRSRFIVATGQSGHPLSPLFGNLAERWRDGAWLPLAPEGGDAKQRLVLAPE